jgi:hypothetical protein
MPSEPVICVAFAASLAACPSSVDAPSPSPALERVDLGDHRGLSGLTRDGDGRLWSVIEHGGALLGFAADGGDQRSVPIPGFSDAVDLESITWLGGDRFAAGTEAREATGSDEILVLEVAGGAAAIVDRIVLDYAELGVEPRDNQGIEGLCAAGSLLLAALETPVEARGRRAARLVRIDTATGARTPLSMLLTSATGKISGLDCRRSGSGLEVLAIERHFEVSRILHLTIADSATGAETLRPSIAADLNDIRRPTDNHEGIVRDGARAALLVLDNDFGGVAGPTELHRAAIAVD